MKLNTLNVWNGVSVIILVGSEVIALAAAGAWAIAGLVGLAPVLSYALLFVAVAAGIAATAIFARHVHRVEPFFDRLSPVPQTAAPSHGSSAPPRSRGDGQ